MDPKAEQVLGAVRSTWTEWSEKHLGFPAERDMHGAFRKRLLELLPTGFDVVTEYRPPTISSRLSAWSRFDIAVLNRSDLIALLELSLRDTNVPHALHNGELKLLGNTKGQGVTSRRTFAAERGMTPVDCTGVESALAAIPIRGLFFVQGERRDVLDRPDRAKWWETKGKGFEGETKFYSALLAPGQQATLREAFASLAAAGLWCWFYSLWDEPTVEFRPQRPA